MKKILSLLAAAALMLFSFSSACAQSAAWQSPCIAAPYDYSYQDDMRSIVIRRFSQDSLAYLVADVQVSRPDALKTVASSQFLPLSSLAQECGAVLAVNGDDYATHEYGVIIRNGKLLRAHGTTRHLLAVDPQGNMSLVTDRKSVKAGALADQLTAAGIVQAFEFGPALVQNGQALSFPSSFDLISTRPSRKEPRTAIGQIGPLHYLLVVVDGRQPGYSEGISLQDLQQLMLQYGAQTAFNLDGGGSAEMWFMGEIINRPSGDHERSMSDAIYF